MKAITWLRCVGPWFLVRKGRLDDARKSLRRLARDGHYSEQRLDQEIALMIHTNEMEKAEMKGAGYVECFRGTNRRRTEIVSCPLCRARHSRLIKPVLRHLDHPILLRTADLWIRYPIVRKRSLAKERLLMLFQLAVGRHVHYR